MWGIWSLSSDTRIMFGMAASSNPAAPANNGNLELTFSITILDGYKLIGRAALVTVAAKRLMKPFSR